MGWVGERGEQGGGGETFIKRGVAAFAFQNHPYAELCIVIIYIYSQSKHGINFYLMAIQKIIPIPTIIVTRKEKNKQT